MYAHVRACTHVASRAPSRQLNSLFQMEWHKDGSDWHCCVVVLFGARSKIQLVLCELCRHYPHTTAPLFSFRGETVCLGRCRCRKMNRAATSSDPSPNTVAAAAMWSAVAPLLRRRRQQWLDRGGDSDSQRQRFSAGPASAPSALADGQQQSEHVRTIERVGVSSKLEADPADTTATPLSATSDRVCCLNCLAPKGVVATW
jgi:hypothetical protein